MAHALAVLNAMFRWLVEQRYVVANPFAGIKVRGSQRAMAVETTHAFTEEEWLLVCTIANGLEWSYGWQAQAAQRLRFLLDFGYATGLRISELANATLRNIEVDAAGDHWLHLVGKGGKPARVTLTPLACVALDRYLQERGAACQPRSLGAGHVPDRQPGRRGRRYHGSALVGDHAQVL